VKKQAHVRSAVIPKLWQENHGKLANYISAAPDQSRGKIRDAISKGAEVIDSYL